MLLQAPKYSLTIFFLLFVKEHIRIKHTVKVLRNVVPVHPENSAKELGTKSGPKNVKLVLSVMAVPIHLLQLME